MSTNEKENPGPALSSPGDDKMMPVLGLPKLLASMADIKKALSDFTEFKDAVVLSDERNFQRVKRYDRAQQKEVEVIYITKQGWRLIAWAFGISLEIVGKYKEEYKEPIVDEKTKSTRPAYVWRVAVRATLPTGRSVVSEGACSNAEARFLKMQDHGKEDHDTFATAETRAKNRAISDLVGAGEVSAEEVDAEAGKDERGAPEHAIYGCPHCQATAITEQMILEHMAKLHAGKGGTPKVVKK